MTKEKKQSRIRKQLETAQQLQLFESEVEIAQRALWKKRIEHEQQAIADMCASASGLDFFSSPDLQQEIVWREQFIATLYRLHKRRYG